MYVLGGSLVLTFINPNDEKVCMGMGKRGVLLVLYLFFFLSVSSIVFAAIADIFCIQFIRGWSWAFR